ncbi:glycoside hydrolase family 113 [Lutibacter citreus]|uniref:glycoside hydrolase family 113 n=1 Tax=Lutibacter citreus TaxID=2138210 RepID=UPI000DBE9139|nr:hypothetical protein [Lutibacter citreus]
MQTKNYAFLSLIISLFFSCGNSDEDFLTDCDTDHFNIENKIKGGSVLETWKLSLDGLNSIKMAEKTNANWIALSPQVNFIYLCENFHPCRPYEYQIEREIDQLNRVIPKVINSGFQNILLKPLTSFWEVNGSNFWGDFYVTNETEWKEIEATYSDLLYEFAKIANKFPEVKMLSIGNELREFVKRRPEFFKSLIRKIKTDFPNLKLTYAANWDEYKHVNFWDDLDYIGINSYFPLVNKRTPTYSQLINAFEPVKNKLHNLSCKYNKPILFTEYGYRSMDFGAWKGWELGEINSKNINYKTQSNTYESFYDTFWDENWVAGGFFWEWKLIFENETNNSNENGWYVNDKPAQEIIKSRYTD